jgi:hypothetical protein
MSLPKNNGLQRSLIRQRGGGWALVVLSLLLTGAPLAVDAQPKPAEAVDAPAAPSASSKPWNQPVTGRRQQPLGMTGNAVVPGATTGRASAGRTTCRPGDGGGPRPPAGASAIWPQRQRSTSPSAKPNSSTPLARWLLAQLDRGMSQGEGSIPMSSATRTLASKVSLS